MEKLEYTITLTKQTCCSCGTPFGVESVLDGYNLRTGNTFYCPNGHPQVYSDPIEKRLKRAQESEKFWREQAEEKAAQLKTTRAKLTRTEKRIKGGVCPCCNRQFVALAHHMSTKHPDYSHQEGE